MKVALENVTKEFKGKNKTITAVNNLSVILESGKLVGFLGPSGCGKSTTLFMLAGIYDANNGKIFF